MVLSPMTWASRASKLNEDSATTTSEGTTMNIRVTRLAATVGIAGLVGGLAGCGESASSGPEPRATVAPSLPPAGDLILQESFDDDTNGWGIVHHPEFGDADYEDGTYVWKTTGRVVSLVPEK